MLSPRWMGFDRGGAITAFPWPRGTGFFRKSPARFSPGASNVLRVVSLGGLRRSATRSGNGTGNAGCRERTGRGTREPRAGRHPRICPRTAYRHSPRGYGAGYGARSRVEPIPSGTTARLTSRVKLGLPPQLMRAPVAVLPLRATGARNWPTGSLPRQRAVAGMGAN